MVATPQFYLNSRIIFWISKNATDKNNSFMQLQMFVIQTKETKLVLLQPPTHHFLTSNPVIFFYLHEIDHGHSI